jgi:hypothetical protein
MADKDTHDELVGSIQSPGWTLKGDLAVSGTLEDVLKAAHERQAAGQPPGLIERVETAIELDMMQIEMLWRYLGLPV